MSSRSAPDPRPYIPATLRWDYGERRPLAETWADASAAARARALPYWLRKAERDPWAFRELLALAATLEESGTDKPEALRAFMLVYLRGEREPPKGWKSNPTRDARIAAGVHILTECGLSRRAACRLMAEELTLSPEAVESARRRGESV